MARRPVDHAADLIFDPLSHRYWLRDVEHIGANRGLKVCGLVDDTFFTVEMSERGKHVHAATLLLDGNDLHAIDSRLTGYIDAYQRFLDEQRPVYADQGERHTCWPRGRMAGTIDRRVTSLARRSCRLVLELKTVTVASKASRPPWHRIQTATYLLCEPDYTGRLHLYLCEDGTYDIDDTM